jgi:hypothetical protein
MVLDQIEASWPGLPLMAISPLAEGSDRLVVRRVLARPGAQLIVPLPMSEAEYVRDFTSSHSQDEFYELLAKAHRIVRFPPDSTRPAAYATAGRYIIEQCHVLVALWNGEPANGEGGTGAIVAMARAHQRPLAWIYAHNCASGSPNDAPNAIQGRVTYENFALATR